MPDLHLGLLMNVYDPIPWEDFEQKFRESFGRDMTPEERHWFQTIWSIVKDREQEKSKVAAA